MDQYLKTRDIIKLQIGTIKIEDYSVILIYSTFLSIVHSNIKWFDEAYMFLKKQLEEKNIKLKPEMKNKTKEILESKSYQKTYTYEITDTQYIIRREDIEIKRKRNNFYDELIKEFGEKELFDSYITQLSLLTDYFSTSLPFQAYVYLYKNENLRVEAFASPFDNKLKKFDDTSYFSLFPEDTKLGSRGNIFNLKDMKKQDDSLWIFFPNINNGVYNYNLLGMLKELKNKINYLLIMVSPPENYNKEIQFVVSKMLPEKTYYLVNARNKRFVLNEPMLVASNVAGFDMDKFVKHFSTKTK